MISLTRDRTAAPAGFRASKGLKKKLLLLEAFRANNIVFTSSNSFWRTDKAVKKQLRVESAGKCGYCEALAQTVTHADVEHFRPKSKYWWLAYCYDNYVYACEICNQSFKGDEFPIHGDALQISPPLPNPFPAILTPQELEAIAKTFAPDPVVDGDGLAMQAFEAAATQEKAGLPDPYRASPEELFKWEADPVLKEVSIRAKDNTVKAKRAFNAVTQFLGLNRPELLGARWREFSTLLTLKEVFESGELSAPLQNLVKAQILAAMDGSAPFSGMSRFFVKEEWQLDLD